MQLKKNKPTTSSQRQLISFQNKLLSKIKLNKKLKKGFKRSFGRNNQGRITVQARGGGHKRLYRFISFNRKLVEGVVTNILYDPNRTANIALIENQNSKFFILAPNDLKINSKVESSENCPIHIGNALPLRKIPIGTLVHNISLQPNSKGKLIRSAGTSAQLIQKINDKYAKIKLSSGEQRLILLNCYATIGTISNNLHKKINLGKAGRKRWLNKKPKVRGVAKNPVDHPHGGGEGKTSGGRPSVSFKGIITKGKKTKKKKNKLILNNKK